MLWKYGCSWYEQPIRPWRGRKSELLVRMTTATHVQWYHFLRDRGVDCCDTNGKAVRDGEIKRCSLWCRTGGVRVVGDMRVIAQGVTHKGNLPKQHMWITGTAPHKWRSPFDVYEVSWRARAERCPTRMRFAPRIGFPVSALGGTQRFNGAFTPQYFWSQRFLFVSLCCLNYVERMSNSIKGKNILFSRVSIDQEKMFFL